MGAGHLVTGASTPWLNNRSKRRFTNVFVARVHSSITVTINFYRDKLGFEVHTDAMVGEDFRFLTLNVKGQPGFEIILMEPKAGMLMDEETAAQLRSLIDKGVLGAGAFHTDDCRATYEELKSKGVEFLSEPSERHYGIEAVFKDNSGNWFSLTQPTEEYN